MGNSKLVVISREQLKSKLIYAFSKVHTILFFSIHRLTSQLSIQPNIPSNLLLGQGIDGRKSSGNIVTPKASLNFPTKTLRTKSLLWTKPTGVAITSLSSTVKQVRNLFNFLLFCF